MHSIRPGEDATERNRRVARETQALEAVIRERDAATVPTEAERVALREMENRSRRMPHDYAAILKYRAEAPGLFVHLPDDDECRRALAAAGPAVCTCHEADAGWLRIEAGCPSHGQLATDDGQRKTLRLKK